MQLSLFLILRMLKQQRLNLKKYINLRKSLILNNFLVPQNQECFVSYKKKINSQSLPLMFSIYSFFFPKLSPLFFSKLISKILSPHRYRCKRRTSSIWPDN